RGCGRIRRRRFLSFPPDECVRGYVFSDGAKSQGIHYRDRARAHGEDVPQDAAYTCGGSLKGLDEGGMIVRFDFEGAGPAVPDIDDPGILARALQDALAAGGEAFQVNARRFVGAVLAPHHAENAEFVESRLASTEELFDLFVLVQGEAVLPDRLRGKGRGQGSNHG